MHLPAIFFPEILLWVFHRHIKLFPLQYVKRGKKKKRPNYPKVAHVSLRKRVSPVNFIRKTVLC